MSVSPQFSQTSKCPQVWRCGVAQWRSWPGVFVWNVRVSVGNEHHTVGTHPAAQAWAAPALGFLPRFLGRESKELLSVSSNLPTLRYRVVVAMSECPTRRLTAKKSTPDSSRWGQSSASGYEVTMKMRQIGI